MQHSAFYLTVHVMLGGEAGCFCAMDPGFFADRNGLAWERNTGKGSETHQERQ